MIAQNSVSQEAKAPWHRGKGVVMGVSLMVVLQACMTSRADRSDTTVARYQPASEALQRSQRAFAERNPPIASAVGDLKWTIRMATPAEIPEDDYKVWLYPPAQGAAALALGLGAPPMFASALVVGGALLIPLGSYIYVHEKAIWDVINGALIHAEFTPAIDGAMKDRLHAAFAGTNMPDVQIEIILEAFGVVKAGSAQQHCFVVASNLLLRRGNAVFRQDNLRITELNRSEDAPPPQCAKLESFAKNNARLLKDAVAEYAHVLAAMAIDRIPRGSTK